MWQPIETAPKHYTTIILCDGDVIGEGWYASHLRSWEFANPAHTMRRNPTRWMPLPDNRDPQFIYECSNPGCGLLWQSNPNGRCPACIKPNGGGWSTIERAVLPVEEYRRTHRASALSE